MTEQRQKTVLITGASSGIGHSLAIEFSKNNYHVFACARRLEPMEDLVEHGVNIFKMDVNDLDSVLKGKEFIKKELINLQKTEDENELKLDILYNNAGVSCTLPALDVDDKAAKDCFETNVFGPVRLVREFSDFVINSQGLIIFTGSIAGIAPFPFSSIYGATKAAIHQYANSLSLEMEPFNVKVMNVVTGGVLTNIADTRELPSTSRYYCDKMVESFERRKKMAKENTPMSSEEYAKRVLKSIENYDKPLIGGYLNYYKGSFASLVSFMCFYLPRSLATFIFKRRFILVDAFEEVKDKNSKKLKRN